MNGADSTEYFVVQKKSELLGHLFGSVPKELRQRG